MKAFVSWSGGKDSALSCYRAAQGRECEPVSLLNMLSEDGRQSSSHGTDSLLLRLQAEALGIPVIQAKTSQGGYEGNFKAAVEHLKKKGITAGIFGDIDFQCHRDWIERVCDDLTITPVFPLWGGQRKELLQEFISSGFKAVVVKTRSDFLDKNWLGRLIDYSFIRDIEKLQNVDICGENGEYHTFVYDGPIFKKPFKFRLGKEHVGSGYCFIEVIPA